MQDVDTLESESEPESRFWGWNRNGINGLLAGIGIGTGIRHLNFPGIGTGIGIKMYPESCITGTNGCKGPMFLYVYYIPLLFRVMAQITKISKCNLSQRASSVRPAIVPKIRNFLSLLLLESGRCEYACYCWRHIFEPICAYCTVGSYASLSVCLSVRPAVCHGQENGHYLAHC